MRERLREITEQFSGRGVAFLAEEAEIVSQAQELLEHLGRNFDLANASESLDEPERTGEERSLAAGQAVVAGRVAKRGPPAPRLPRIASTVPRVLETSGSNSRTGRMSAAASTSRDP